jgi:hypothetical protein
MYSRSTVADLKLGYRPVKAFVRRQPNQVRIASYGSAGFLCEHANPIYGDGPG